MKINLFINLFQYLIKIWRNYQSDKSINRMIEKRQFLNQINNFTFKGLFSQKLTMNKVLSKKQKIRNYVLIEDQINEHEIIKKFISTDALVCIKEYLTAQEFIYSNDYEDLNIDLIICDINLPVLKGIEFSKVFRVLNKTIPILLVSHGKHDSIQEQIQNIPNTYYSSKDPSLLPLAIEAVFKNEHLNNSNPLVLDWEKRNEFYKLDKFDEIPPEQKLNDFERNVLKLIGEDFTIKEIADKLKTSKSTISHTKTELVRRLNLKNPKQLVIYGVVYGYI